MTAVLVVRMDRSQTLSPSSTRLSRLYENTSLCTLELKGENVSDQSKGIFGDIYTLYMFYTVIFGLSWLRTCLFVFRNVSVRLICELPSTVYIFHIRRQI